MATLTVPPQLSSPRDDAMHLYKAFKVSNMAEGAGQEGFFWDAYPWVMSDKSGGSGEAMDGSGGGDVIVTTIGGGSKRTDGAFEMKQPEVRGMDGSSGDNKRNDDTFEMKNEDPKVSLRVDKGKRVLEPSDGNSLVWLERERRKKMSGMFHQLHALIPQLPPKADKYKIVDEAISYITTLQQTLENLESKKHERLRGLLANTTNALPIQPQQLIPDTTRESFLANQIFSTSQPGIVSPLGSTSVSTLTVFRSWASSNVTLNACGQDAHINICSLGFPGLFTAICLILEKHKLGIVSAHISTNQSLSLLMIHAHANTGDQEEVSYDEIYEQAATEIMHLVNSS